MIFFVSSSGACRRAARINSDAPATAKDSDMALPMPAPEPVTNAVLPAAAFFIPCRGSMKEYTSCLVGSRSLNDILRAAILHCCSPCCAQSSYNVLLKSGKDREWLHRMEMNVKTCIVSALNGMP